MKLPFTQLECAIHWARRAPYYMSYLSANDNWRNIHWLKPVHCYAPYVEVDDDWLTISSAIDNASSTFGWYYKTTNRVQGAVDLEMLLRAKSVSRLLRLVKGTGAPKPEPLQRIESLTSQAKMVNTFSVDTLLVRQSLLRVKSDVVQWSIEPPGTLKIANITLNVQQGYGSSLSAHYKTDSLRAVFSVTCSDKLTAIMLSLPNDQVILELNNNAHDCFENHKLLSTTATSSTKAYPRLSWLCN